MFFLFLALWLSSAVNIENKELVCFHASTYVLEHQRQEIQEYCRKNRQIKDHAIKIKIADVSYRACIEKITDEDVELLENDKIKTKEFAKDYLVRLEDYQSEEDIKVGPEFFAKRREISKRINDARKKSLEQNLDL